MIHIGVCYRFNEHLCYLNLAWQQRHKEHVEQDNTTFDKWLTADNATIHVILKKQFYVRYNKITKSQCKKDISKSLEIVGYE